MLHPLSPTWANLHSELAALTDAAVEFRYPDRWSVTSDARGAFGTCRRVRTQSVLTVDQNGNPVTAPTNGTTTAGTLPAAVTAEATAIAAALNLTVPASTAKVQVTTPAGGTAVYTIHLTASNTSTSTFSRGRTVSIDANGNPVGNQNLPFVAIPAAIQTALNNNRPSGATALATTATQNVTIRTNSGVTTYSTTFTTTGTSTVVTVNAAGALALLPTHSTTTFSALSTVVQNAIRAWLKPSKLRSGARRSWETK